MCSALFRNSASAAAAAIRRSAHSNIGVQTTAISEDVTGGRLIWSESREDLCRICQSGSSIGQLISPCQCKGTLGAVHKACIEMWLCQSNATQCEICCAEFSTIRTQRPCWEWLRDPASPSDTRNLVADTVCFFVLLPLSCISTWLCILGTKHYLAAGVKGEYEALGLILVTCFLIMVFLGWVIVTVRYHYTVWADWRDAHFRIQIVGNRKLEQFPKPKRTKIKNSIASTGLVISRRPLITRLASDTPAVHQSNIINVRPTMHRALSHSSIQPSARVNERNIRRFSCIETSV